MFIPLFLRGGYRMNYIFSLHGSQYLNMCGGKRYCYKLKECQSIMNEAQGDEFNAKIMKFNNRARF